jgi:hypothetical protein
VGKKVNEELDWNTYGQFMTVREKGDKGDDCIPAGKEG